MENDITENDILDIEMRLARGDIRASDMERLLGSYKGLDSVNSEYTGELEDEIENLKDQLRDTEEELEALEEELEALEEKKKQKEEWRQ